MYIKSTKDYRKIVNGTRGIVFICIAFVSACSSSTPEIVSNLNKTAIPVIQSPTSSAKIKQEVLSSIYLKNTSVINRLTVYLKAEYLQGTDRKDIFDVHSVAHQVYDSLTKLEQIKLVNDQYFQDGNYEGLVKLSTILRSFEREMSSQ
ncbi:hypothetical protein RS584_15860 [Enterobacter sp. DTU_2021_1002640_1_SI_PRY_ASU_LCPMC_013]|uniref:hypothetical protein n=1 Tax=Enterobacter sp. DTU_2021_1002640_1_SI_PRY_ASU_LCPMC_013 TaxID=3077940 RepID=UPI0028F0F83A|nr:hypothetical protein [Enterobacter sp. DTU_2021_1002640_1_SI_PRY_ASU_LCPMC_013]WNU99170.1 hypothetical protein RS584_15860 [Enterobacter sp. DTU_2021_1002640_1_SI_PRY_ASU_LCPMC_013]